MPRTVTARQRADHYRAEARAALITLKLRPGVDVRRSVQAGLEYWECFNPTPVELALLLPGRRWYLRMKWVVLSDPKTHEGVLTESSISLNVESSLTDALSTECLVRYDVDHRLTSPTYKFAAAHLNVLQPGALEDRAHYPVIGAQLEEWPIREVLAFFLSDELRSDLVGRLPP